MAALDADMEAAACDYEKLQALVKEKEAAQAELDALYEKWEQLSEEAGNETDLEGPGAWDNGRVRPCWRRWPWQGRAFDDGPHVGHALFRLFAAGPAAALLALELWRTAGPPVQSGLVVAAGIPGRGVAGAGAAGAASRRGDRRGAPPDPRRPADAVIVLGAGVNGTALAVPEDPAGRGLSYLEAYPDVPVVLTGGQGYGEEITEAPCMYDYLTDRGVDGGPADSGGGRLQHGGEFRLFPPLLAEAGVDPATDTVAVVTNDFHIARARLIAARKGYGHAVGVPARCPGCIWR
ncbi:MAG: ElyC/SanA/YdcF family protein [Dysosmobacter sp.]